MALSNLQKNIIGNSEIMEGLFTKLKQVAQHDVPVLIEGESGTGKELFARAMHYNSPRKDKEFVVINCSAFSDSLLESELFGHLKGAFTGAIKEKKGLFEVANNGTFFLDEIGDMSPALQVKLLRVLQEGTFLKIGGVSPVKVNLRIIAATNKKLSKLVAEGTFREDLFYRVNVVHFELPPLRQRKGDIRYLVDYFLKRNAELTGQEAIQVSDEAMHSLESYHWPGNVRQLENEIAKASIFVKENKIELDNLSPFVIECSKETTSEDFEGDMSFLPPYELGVDSLGDIKRSCFEKIEKKLILEGLDKTNWNKTECAKLLQISRGDLMRKITKYDINR